MSELSHFQSRPGKLSCNPADAFVFITDMRNFGRFVNEGTISNWHAEKEECSFSVSMLGTVNVRLIEKEFSTRVTYQGDALSKDDFTINVEISGGSSEQAEVNLSLSANMNPVMKMMADKPVRQFLEILMQEIESFRDWNKITE
jgi:carbon monoxide dehydrogenase subunit G